MVLGATNKPQSIDPAIQRRMPRTFLVPLPDESGRRQILDIMLKDERLTSDAKASIPQLAKVTVNYSGSDLKEMCKAAAMVGIQERTAEYARKRVSGQSVSVDRSVGKRPMRPISRNDLVSSLRKVRPTGVTAKEYGKSEERASASPDFDKDSLENLVRLMQQMSASVGPNSDGNEEELELDNVPQLN